MHLLGAYGMQARPWPPGEWRWIKAGPGASERSVQTAGAPSPLPPSGVSGFQLTGGSGEPHGPSRSEGAADALRALTAPGVPPPAAPSALGSLGCMSGQINLQACDPPPHPTPPLLQQDLPSRPPSRAAGGLRVARGRCLSPRAAREVPAGPGRAMAGDCAQGAPAPQELRREAKRPLWSLPAPHPSHLRPLQPGSGTFSEPQFPCLSNGAGDTCTAKNPHPVP